MQEIINKERDNATAELELVHAIMNAPDMTEEELKRLRKTEKREYIRDAILDTVTNSCRLWRLSMGYTITEIAADLNMAKATITQFEKGQDNSAVILFWYIAHGMDFDRYTFSRKSGEYMSATYKLQNIIKEAKEL